VIKRTVIIPVFCWALAFVQRTVIIPSCSGDLHIICYVINIHYCPLTILLLLSGDSLSLLGEVSLFHYIQSVAILLVEFGTFLFK
jgi:hypothetical protein